MDQLLAGGLPAVVAGMCSVSFLYLGIYLLLATKKDARFRSLTYLCFFSCAWCLCYVMYFLSADGHAAGLWLRLVYAGMLAFVFLLWFTIDYFTPIGNRTAAVFLRLALLLPPLVCAYKSIVDNAVAADFPSGFWFLFLQIQTTVYNIASISLFSVFYLRRNTSRRRLQARMVCASGAALVALSWIADYVLTAHNTRNIMPFWLLLWFGILIYPIRKHRLIVIAAESMGMDVTENIEEGIMFLDPDRKVVFANTAIRRMIGVGEDLPARLSDFIMEADGLDAGLSGLIQSDSVSFRIRVNVKPPASAAKAAVDVMAKKVLDAFGDLSGFLLIVSTVRDLGQLRILYGITGRELDVIRQLSTGRTNRDIADLFGLTERTVETHLTSIYTKLGVRNRIEMLNMISGFDPGGGPRPSRPVTPPARSVSGQ